MFNKFVVQAKLPDYPGPLDDQSKIWLSKALREEVQELQDAVTTADEVDALVDLVIFALGGLYRMGLSPDQARECFTAVMEANFEKKAGVKPGREVSGVADAVKPDGWVPPEERIEQILENMQ
jgi:predicted HAD superfamily Cof-like phosphohydrolase